MKPMVIAGSAGSTVIEDARQDSPPGRPDGGLDQAASCCWKNGPSTPLPYITAFDHVSA